MGGKLQLRSTLVAIVSRYKWQMLVSQHRGLSRHEGTGENHCRHEGTGENHCRHEGTGENHYRHEGT